MVTDHDKMVKELVKHSEGPYMYISQEKTVTFKGGGDKRTFRFLLYGAFNAMGLIGSECNGILILDEDKTRVLADEIAIEGSGYFGPSMKQVAVFKELTEEMNWPQFRTFINSHARTRYGI